jgi:hypothetical protein
VRQLLHQGGHPGSETRYKVRNIEDPHVLVAAPADTGVDVFPNRYRVVGKGIHLGLGIFVVEQLQNGGGNILNMDEEQAFAL